MLLIAEAHTPLQSEFGLLHKGWERTNVRFFCWEIDSLLILNEKQFMFIRKNEKHEIKYFKKKVSTAFINGGLVSIDSNGFLIPATASSVNHVGVVLKQVLATDSDYASATYIPVDMCRPTDLFIADVSAGTVAQTAVGAYYDLNSTGDKVDLSATSVKAVYVADILLASSQVVVVVNSMAGVDETG